jgi:hypothetical protein
MAGQRDPGRGDESRQAPGQKTDKEGQSGAQPGGGGSRQPSDRPETRNPGGQERRESHGDPARRDPSREARDPSRSRSESEDPDVDVPSPERDPNKRMPQYTDPTRRPDVQGTDVKGKPE